MDILEKIQVGRHSPPPSELVWAVGNDENAGTWFRQCKSCSISEKRKTHDCLTMLAAVWAADRPTPFALEIKAFVGGFRWRKKIK
ncbi:hypothetical protein [Rhizobium leguminosarum]|uniref:hypothetical protein n=1 Tax=Rhizobium leguminosarum TaxID=384 RepID=UPI001C98DC0E|nr:hypothetical protein [Rhizobium leguminosarum]